MICMILQNNSDNAPIVSRPRLAWRVDADRGHAQACRVRPPCPNGKTAYIKLTLRAGAVVTQFKEK